MGRIVLCNEEENNNNSATCCEAFVLIKGKCGSVGYCEMWNRATVVLLLALKL